MTFRASAVAAAPVERRRPTRQTSSLAGQSIMLLEDHRDSRDLFALTLETAGAVVVAFSTVGEAVAALDRVRPSVIVADIGLPGEDGYSFIRRVRAHATADIQGVPAIAVTAHASTPDRAEAIAVGFQQHLSKPIDPAQLVDAVHGVLRKARAR